MGATVAVVVARRHAYMNRHTTSTVTMAPGGVPLAGGVLWTEVVVTLWALSAR